MLIVQMIVNLLIIKDYIQSKKLDIIILDINLPYEPNLKINSGEDLGAIVKTNLPNTKILVCTGYTDVYRLHHIFNSLDPIGFINKQDIGFSGFITAIKEVISNKTYYSQTILKIVKQKSINNISLDGFDILILKELSNGSKMKDLEAVIPQSKSSILKRKKKIREKLDVQSDSDRDLVLNAKKRGFI